MHEGGTRARRSSMPFLRRSLMLPQWRATSSQRDTESARRSGERANRALLPMWARASACPHGRMPGRWAAPHMSCMSPSRDLAMKRGSPWRGEFISPSRDLAMSRALAVPTSARICWPRGEPRTRGADEPAYAGFAVSQVPGRPTTAPLVGLWTGRAWPDA
jgi:hypothetical protein